MQQSMLALLGLIVATIFSFSVTEKTLHYQRAAIVQEVEEMGASVGLRAIEVIRERPFESEILTPTGTKLPLELDKASVADLTARLATAMPQGRGCAVFGAGTDPCADVSAFNQMKTATMPFLAGADTLFFKVDVRVHYVDAALDSSATVTFRKLVTVEVRDYWPHSKRTGFYIPQPITLSRVMTLTL